MRHVSSTVRPPQEAGKRNSTMSSGSDKTVKVAGYLEKKSKLRMMSRWKKLWFVLDGRLLLYYKSRAEYLSLSPCRGTVNMGLATDVASGPKARSILVHTRSHAIALRALSRREHEAWLRALVDSMYQPIGNRAPPISYPELDVCRGLGTLDAAHSEGAILDTYGMTNHHPTALAHYGSAGEVNNNRQASFSPTERHGPCEDDCHIDNGVKLFDRNGTAYASADNVDRHLNRLAAPIYGSTGNVNRQPAAIYGSTVTRKPVNNYTGNSRKSSQVYGSTGNLNQRVATVYGSTGNLNRQQTVRSPGNGNQMPPSKSYGSASNISRQAVYGSTNDVNKQQSPIYEKSVIDNDEPAYHNLVKENRMPAPGYGSNGNINRQPAPVHGSKGQGKQPASVYGSTGNVKQSSPVYGSRRNINIPATPMYGSNGNISRQQLNGSIDNVTRQPDNRQVYGSSGNVRRIPPVYSSGQIYGSNGELKNMHASKFGSNGNVHNAEFNNINTHAALYSPAYGSNREITSSRAALCTSIADSNRDSKLTKRPLCLGEYREKINKKCGKIAMSDSSIPGRFRTRGEESRGLRRSASVEGDLGDNIYESVRDSLYSRGASLRRSDSDCLFLARHRLGRSHPFRSEQKIADYYSRGRWIGLNGGKQARSDTDLTLSPRMIHATNSGTLWFSRREGVSLSSSLAGTAGTTVTGRRPARSRSFLARLVAPATAPARRSLSFLKRLWTGPDRDKLRRDLLDSSRLSPFQYEDFERCKVREVIRYKPPMPEPPPDYDEVNISSGESEWERKSVDSWDGWEEVILAQWERAAAPTPWTDDDRPTIKGKGKMHGGRRGKVKRGAADTMDAKGGAWDGWDTWASRPRDIKRTNKESAHIKRDPSPYRVPALDSKPVHPVKESAVSQETSSPSPSSPTSSPARSSPPPKKSHRLKAVKRADGARQRVTDQSDFGDSESSEMALRRLFSEEESPESKPVPDPLDDMLRRLNDINSVPLQNNNVADSEGEPDYDVPRSHGLAARVNRPRTDMAPLPPTHFLQPAFHDSLDPTSPYDEVVMAPDSLECDPWSDDGCDSWATYAPIHKRFPPDSLNTPLHT